MRYLSWTTIKETRIWIFVLDSFPRTWGILLDQRKEVIFSEAAKTKYVGTDCYDVLGRAGEEERDRDLLLARSGGVSHEMRRCSLGGQY